MKERLLSANEVCVLLDCSIYSLNNWYKFKNENPDNEYAKMLPELVRENGTNGKRMWRHADIGQLIQFKASIPHGRNGVLGSVTQKYVKKAGGKKNGKKKTTSRRKRDT